MVTRRLQATPVETLPRYEGFISVTSNGRYFKDEANQGFLVIGQNDGITWPGLNSLIDCADPDATERYIRDLRESGITVSRIMLEYAEMESAYLENPLGVYSDRIVQFWDNFIALAERHGLYLLLTPYDTFWQNIKFEQYPYSVEKGGPCKSRRDWLTLPAAIEAQKARWEFIINRWGRSPNIFAWDIMNEVDYWWGATPAEIDDYISEMAAYVRGLELRMWGRTHMLTASSATPVPEGALGEVIYNHPALDFANTHLYIAEGVRAPQEPVSVAPEIIHAVEVSLKAMDAPRPYFDSETGPIDMWILKESLDKQYHHNLSWAHLASGAAGSGMRWPYTKVHWILPDCRDNLRGMARLTTQLDWTTFNSRPITKNIVLEQHGIIKAGCADTITGLLWLLRDSRRADCPTLNYLNVSIEAVFEDGDYLVEFWETYNGDIIDTVFAMSIGGTLSFTLPFFDASVEDVAVIIKKIDSTN